MNKYLVSFLVISILVFLGLDAEAQCAMCKQVAEDATNEGGRAAGMGLNNGIKCLLVMPYILFGIFITVFFRKKIRGLLSKANTLFLKKSSFKN